jgi:hypothetical protein
LDTFHGDQDSDGGPISEELAVDIQTASM